MTRCRPATVVVASALLAAVAAGAAAKTERELPKEAREWLEEVDLLITRAEKKAFLELEKEYQRQAFIRRFWEARNPRPGEVPNRFKVRFYQRREEALSKFSTLRDDRARTWTLHGAPSDVFETDCSLLLWPVQIWYYGYVETLGTQLRLIFYQPAAGGPFRLWRPGEGLQVLLAMGRRNETFAAQVRKYCTDLNSEQIEAFLERIREYEREGALGPVRAEMPPPVLDPEWLRTFHAFSTELVGDQPELEWAIELRFPRRQGHRTVVVGEIRVPASSARPAALGGREAFNFQLTGEVLREDELFESFRYRYDLPVRGDVPAELSLLFERALRPGSYRLVLKIEDLNGTAMARRERPLEVPKLEGKVAALLAADAGAAPEEPESFAPAEVELIAEGVDLVSGLARFRASVTGSEVEKVRFLLDGRPLLAKTRPPYSVELDLGDLPTRRSVRVVALDAEGREIATDEVVVNPGEHVFAVRVVEPRAGSTHRGSVRVRAEVQIPEGARVEQLHFYLGDDRVATLFQEPYVHTIPLEGEGLAFVRAVAELEDGHATEDLVVFNAPLPLEDVEVRLVEVFAGVTGPSGRPLGDLGRDDFRVLENGVEQQLLRFEHLENLPIYAGLLLDTSASMADSLDAVRAAALAFFEQTIRPRDRAAVITFSEEPRLATRFTSDLDLLAGGLAGIRAESSTALYDSVLYGLYYFRGVEGQRALVVLSDGEDRRSQTEFDEVLDFARGAGVTVYAIGLSGGRVGRRRLTRMAEETGGRAFFPGSAAELPEIYATIQADLRSRYLLVYQSSDTSGDGFRAIQVQVARSGAEVRALTGYFPR